MLNPQQRAVLCTELKLDPLGMGYAALMAADPVEGPYNVVAALEAPSMQYTLTELSPATIRDSFVLAEWNALPSDYRDSIMAQLALGTCDPSGFVGDLILSSFPTGAQSSQRFEAARTGLRSRIAVLGLPAGATQAGDVLAVLEDPNCGGA